MTQGKRTNIWAAAARQLLFEKLTEFGPYSTWASSSAPGRGRDQRYGEFFQAFAVVIGATSAAAVKHQVLFAVPIKGRAHWRAGHNRTAVLSIAAALNAGFIAQADLPDSLVAENDADDEQPQDFPATARLGRDPRGNEAPRAEAAGIGHG